MRGAGGARASPQIPCQLQKLQAMDSRGSSWTRITAAAERLRGRPAELLRAPPSPVLP